MTRRLLEEFVRRPPAGRRADRLAALTEREVEVLGLMARGWSNAQLAAHLVLSETTGVQAVVVAYETGLVVPRSRRLTVALTVAGV